MKNIKILIEDYVDENISIYFNKLICLLDDLNFAELIDAINPYIFCMNGHSVAGEVVDELFEKWLAAHKEQIFQDWFHDLSVYIRNIGGNATIYTDIIEPLGHKAKEKNDDFHEKYAGMLNRFTKEFIELFCDSNGNIEWKKLVEFNSGKST
ncbi:MAG: hypothetical protein LBT01_05020 [Spirochaetaceae bacterium]|jgi:hypothetical protein|nr:hypothetical protein [Spirochaetaceae bacterium]